MVGLLCINFSITPISDKMKTNFITLSIIWIFTICASAQTQKPERHTPFQPQTEEKRYLPPVPFPKPNMNPDPSIFNEQALISKGGITTELLLDTSLILPESIIVKGNPGNARPVTFPFDDISSRAFSSMMVAQDITEYPLSTAVRLYISWPSGGGQCSGILIDAKHVLTAGHCVYDIDNDEWATSMEVSPAYDDGPNEFFGTSDIGAKISWSGWVENDNFEHDLAVVELTRPVGSLAGWCGFGYNNSNAYFTGNTFHNYSYPGESPYDGETMYYRNGNYDAPQQFILYHNNYSWGGQSGSGAPDGDQIAYSALSHTTFNDLQTGHTRITSTKFTDIQNFIAENTPDETDFVAMKAEASHEVIAPGEWLDFMNFFLYNNSAEAFTGNINVDYYLSTDDYIGAGGDILLTSLTTWVDDLEGKGAEWIFNYFLTQIPTDVAPGNYYIGMHVTNSDFYSLNNYTDYQDAFPITIVCGVPEAPELNLSGFITKCDNALLYFEPLNICEGCEVHWSTGDVSPSLIVDDAGVYYAYFVNECGNVSEESFLAIVDEIPDPETPDILTIGPTTFCDEDYVELYVDNICPGCTVYWSTGETGESILVFESGTYTAYMENICSFSSYADPIEVIVELAPLPTVIMASGPTALCSGESVTLSADFVCDECEVIWSNGQTGPDITVSTPGTYTAVVENECGTSGISNSITVTLQSGPAAPQINASGPTQLCTGQSVNLTATNVCNGCTVTWSNGQTGAMIAVNTSGNYTAIVSNDCGDSQTSNAINVTIESLPPAASISAVGGTQLCEGQSVTLEAINVCSGCTVQWSNGTQGNATVVNTTGTYTAIMSNACGQGAISNAIQVTSAPSFIPVVQVNNTCHLAAPNGSDYQWLLNGQEISNANAQFWTAATDGYYTVRMKGPDGCEGTSNPLFATACITAVVEPIYAQNLRVYPNPATDRIRVEWTAAQSLTNVRMILYTMQGSTVEQIWSADHLAGGSLIDISLPALPSGMYLYALVSEEMRVPGYLVVVN